MDNASSAPSGATKPGFAGVELVITRQPMSATDSGHNVVRSTSGLEAKEAVFRAQSWLRAGYCATLIDQEGKVLWEAQPNHVMPQTPHFAEVLQ